MANRPTTTKEAFNHGYQSHVEGLNPFRNTDMSDHELYSAWVEGFEKRQEEMKEEAV